MSITAFGHCYGGPHLRKEDIKEEEVIGKGMYATVYKGKCRNLVVAIKIPHNQAVLEKNIADFRKEVRIMR